jgi:hypothetical protein
MAKVKAPKKKAANPKKSRISPVSRKPGKGKGAGSAIGGFFRLLFSRWVLRVVLLPILIGVLFLAVG